MLLAIYGEWVQSASLRGNSSHLEEGIATMQIPGFTAHLSLCRGNEGYWMNEWLDFERASKIVTQLRKERTFSVVYVPGGRGHGQLCFCEEREDLQMSVCD